MNYQKIGNIKGSTLKGVNVNIQEESDKQTSVHLYLWGIVIIILLAILGTQIPKMDSGNSSVTLIISFIGILATFIVISNYAQIKNIENKFDVKTKELEKIFNQNISDTIEDYNHTVNAITKQLSGKVYAKEIPAVALELYIDALEEINKAIKNKSPMDGIVEDILNLEQVEKVNIRISTDEKKRYGRVIIESGHDETEELLDFINSLEVDYSV